MLGFPHSDAPSRAFAGGTPGCPSRPPSSSFIPNPFLTTASLHYSLTSPQLATSLFQIQRGDERQQQGQRGEPAAGPASQIRRPTIKFPFLTPPPSLPPLPCLSLSPSPLSSSFPYPFLSWGGVTSWNPHESGKQDPARR